jgi:hypothetical protein
MKTPTEVHHFRLLPEYLEVQENGSITKLYKIKSCCPYKKETVFSTSKLLLFSYLGLLERNNFCSLVTEGSWEEIASAL